MADKAFSVLATGAWDSGTAYTVGDIVDSAGSSYACIANNTNQQPPNATYWALLASKGDTGATGATGAAGATGAQGPQGDPGDMTNPMTTEGDIIYGAASGSPTRLAKGTSGQFLKQGASIPAWTGIVEADISDLQSYLLPADIGSTVQAFDAFLDDIAALTDPGANSILGWDDTAGAMEFLTQGEVVAILGGVLQDLDTLGAAASDGQFIVATGVGAFAYESGATVRTSLGLGSAALVATDLSDLNEATIEAAIDTLANLVSIQGFTVTLADAGANAIFGWDDVAGAYENLTAAEVVAVISGTIAYSDLANGTDGELITWGADAAPATVAAGTSGQVLTSNGAGAAPTFQDAGGGGAGWTFVEEKVVSTAGTSQVFSSLDGDADAVYMIVARIINDAESDVKYYLRPDSSAITTQKQTLIASSTSVSAARAEDASLGHFFAEVDGAASAAFDSSMVIAYYYAKTGAYRWLQTEFTRALDTTSPWMGKIISFDVDTSTNYTSIQIFADTANGIGVGTVITLFKRSTS